MKIYFHNNYKEMKKTTSIWWLLHPEFDKLWSGKIIYIGLRGWNIELDFRGINNIYDLARELRNPKPSKSSNSKQ
jgi:hypothetical protein